MKAAVYTGIREIEVQEIDRVPAASDYVVIDTKVTGICGSDLHAYYGEWPPTPGEAAGHETCGVVVEVGAGVDHVREGDRVVMEVTSNCGRCLYCRKGQYNHCVKKHVSWKGGHGGFAEYTNVHASTVFQLPDSITYRQGALVEPLAVGYRAVMRAEPSHQDRLAVIGGGTIGLLTLAAAKAVGVRETLITVKYDQQAEIARHFGADHVVDINDTDVREYVRDFTDGHGLDVVVETVGSAQGFDDALNIIRPQGTVVLVGGYHKPLEVDLSKIMNLEPIVTGSLCYSYSGMVTDFDAAIELIDTGAVDAERIVTHDYGLEETPEAFRVSSDKNSGVVKAHIVQE